MRVRDHGSEGQDSGLDFLEAGNGEATGLANQDQAEEPNASQELDEERLRASGADPSPGAIQEGIG